MSAPACRRCWSRSTVRIAPSRHSARRCSSAERLDAELVLMTTPWEATGSRRCAGISTCTSRCSSARPEPLVVLDREAPDAILSAATTPGTLVCMTTHGRSGVARAALGSVAEAVVRGSERSRGADGTRVAARLGAPAVADRARRFRRLCVRDARVSAPPAISPRRWAPESDWSRSSRLPTSLHVSRFRARPRRRARGGGERVAGDGRRGRRTRCSTVSTRRTRSSPRRSGRRRIARARYPREARRRTRRARERHQPGGASCDRSGAGGCSVRGS